MRAALAASLDACEAAFDRAFGQAGNPWRHLGSLAFLLVVVTTATGIVVYAVYDTSVGGAYRSVRAMSAGPPAGLALARSVHRYASDALVLTMIAHLAREWLRGHAAGFRWFSWLSGVPLVALVYASGIGGYWLPFDQLAQLSLTATTEWLDALPLFGEPLARNFVSPASVPDRLLSLLVFLHIGIPLALLAFIGVHLLRLTRPRSFPPATIAAATCAALVVLALMHPARALAEADFGSEPMTVAFDWPYLFIHALQYRTSPQLLWAAAGAAGLVLAVLPWIERTPHAPAACVDLANCNGCGRCFADCPYAAITLVARSDGRHLARQAEVDPQRCASCGICAGACPSSTPFRSGSDLATGIDLPQAPIRALRASLDRALETLAPRPAIVVFGCASGVEVASVREPGTAPIELVCIAMLPPSFVEYALRAGADGVMVSGCREGDCAYRLGHEILRARLEGSREPRLRARVSRARVRTFWGARADARSLSAAVAAFRRDLAASPRAAGPSMPPKRREALDA
jgi:coenzyme F420-reducing hydrogenase delta subunit/ferredoxin